MWRRKFPASSSACGGRSSFLLGDKDLLVVLMEAEDQKLIALPKEAARFASLKASDTVCMSKMRRGGLRGRGRKMHRIKDTKRIKIKWRCF